AALAEAKKITLTDPVEILECAEGMSAYAHGSDGFNAYRNRLCDLLGVDAGADFDGMEPPHATAVAPKGVVEELRDLGAKYIPSNDDYHRFLTYLSQITELPE